MPKRQPTIRELPREIPDESPSLILRTAYYANDIVENFKDAIQDLVIDGAKGANFLGMEINVDKLNDRIHKLFDWEKHTKWSTSTIKQVEQYALKLEGTKFQDKLDRNQIDALTPEGVQELKNALPNLLQQELQDKINEGGQNKASLQALLRVYQAQYLKAIKEAKVRGVDGVDFNQFNESFKKEILAKTPEFAKTSR